MSTYAEQYTLSQDGPFQNKIRVAMVRACNAVFAQTIPPPAQAQLQLATAILKDPATYVPVVAIMVMSDTTVAGSAPTGGSLTDAQIQTAVNTYLNNFSR